MVDITFLELHVEDSSFTKEGGTDGEVAVEAAEEAVPPGSGGSSKGAVLAALVGLAFLAVVAYVARRRFLNEEAEEEGFEYDDYD